MSRRMLASVVLVLALAVVAFVVVTGSDDPPVDEDGGIDRAEETGEGGAPRLHGTARDTDPEGSGRPEPREEPVDPGAATRLVVEVFDAAGEAPLAGVRVTFEREGAGPEVGTTPDSGEVTFEWAGAGVGRVTCEREGYVTVHDDDVDLEAGHEGGITLYLERGVATFGRVVRASDGRAVVGAQVTAVEGGEHAGIISSGSGESYGPAVTDREGRVRFTALVPTDIYTFKVRAAGCALARQSFFPRDHASRKNAAVVRVAPGGCVVGRVFGPDGRPVSGATVQLDYEEDFTATTDAGGRYAIDHLTFERRYDAIASGSAFADSAETEGIVTTEDQPEAVVDLTLRLQTRLVVRLVDEVGRPVLDEGELALGSWPVGGWQAKRVEDADGEWLFAAVDPGEHAVRIEIPGYRRVVRRVNLVAAEPKRLEIVLARGLHVGGVVVDDRGKPVVGARVSVQATERHGGGQARATTDVDGRFRLSGLRDGKHRVTVNADWHDQVFVEDVEPPRDDLRVGVVRMATLVVRLRLPAGVPPPDTLWLNHTTKGGGSGTGESWKEEPYEYVLPAGARRFEIEGKGIASWGLDLDLEPGERKDLGTIALEEGVTLRVTVVDLEGAPVPGVPVSMRSAGETWRMFAPPLTNAEGRADVPNLNPGPHEVAAEPEGYLGLTEKVTVGASGGRVTLRLARGGLLRARVLDAEGAPVEGTKVFARRLEPAPDGTWTWRDDTDELGWVERRDVPGRYRVWIGEENAPTTTEEVVLAEGDTEEMVFRKGG